VKKKILAIAVLVLYSLIFCMPVMATGEDVPAQDVPALEQYIYGAEYFTLTDEELQSLNAQAKQIYETYGAYVFMVRENTLARENVNAYAGSFLAEKAPDGNGVVLVIGAENSYFQTAERYSVMFTDTDRENIWSSFLSGATDCERIAAYLSSAEQVFASHVIPDNRLLPRVVDNADLLSSSEERELCDKLDEISTRQQLDVVVVTTVTTYGKSVMDYADDFFDYNGYGFGSERDGVLLMVDMGNRDWWIATTGYGIEVFTDAGIDYIGEKVQPYLSDADYYDGFECFGNLCDQFITQAKTDVPYDRGNLPKDPVSPMWIPGSLLLGALPSGLVSNSMKSKLKTARSRSRATGYVDNAVSNATRQNDIFLYRNVTRSAIVQDSSSGSGGGGSSTHFGSSGSSHGGGGGKF